MVIRISNRNGYAAARSFAAVGDHSAVVGLVEPFAEAADAGPDIPHQIRNFAAAAKEEQRGDREYQNVPYAQCTHGNILSFLYARAEFRWRIS
jgi:hypothetical protein